MNSSYTLESLKQANDWLTRRLQLTEEQVREGEDVNTALTEENRLLKTAKASLSSRLEELCSELDHLRQCVQDYSFEKQNLQSKVGVLEQKVVGYEDDERTAKLMFEELKAEMEEARLLSAEATRKLKT
ncbi:hypothetical protein EB796_016641 [Bugula neritina]|uniref:Uncharacterized protein n=1 Tax=Bugula neritina TaxID=10212 RepID=A0A7J7JHC5_BUGNE|nr:hypothetical protein EB796_016641 [Bugula neritina]